MELPRSELCGIEQRSRSLARRVGGGRCLGLGAFCFVVVVMAVGCGQEDRGTDTSKAQEDQQAPSNAERDGGVRRYLLRGVVERVERESGRVAIRHDEIEGFMPAMTMPFDLAGQEILEELQVGDEVKGSLEVSDTAGTVLRELEITYPALGGPAASDLSSASLETKRLSPGRKVPDFEMTRQDGETFRLSDLRGKVVILTFVYTRCPLPEYCPLLDRKFRSLADRLSGMEARAQGVRLLSVSFDPEHDTPEVLERHARLRGARMPLWSFAVASHDELRKVAEPLGLQYGPTTGEIIHTLSTALIDGEGRLVRLVTGNDWTPEELLKDALLLIGQEAR